MLIDIHCHANLYMNLNQIVNEATSKNVQKIIAVSMSKTSLERIIEIGKYYENIYPALGIHPEEVKMNQNIEQQLDSIVQFIKDNRAQTVAIGEIGLDHHFIKQKELYPVQEKIFNTMLNLAQNLQLPVNLHTKGAEKTVFDTLPSYDIPNVNIHWYSGPDNLLNIGIERGYFFSITPAVFYSPPVKKLVSKVNETQLLLESDGPVKFSGKIGTPAMVKNVLEKISEIKNINKNDLETQIERNTKIIFPKVFL